MSDKTKPVNLVMPKKTRDKLESASEALSLREIDPVSVDAARTAIANNEYRIDAGRIAEAMIRSEQDFRG